jgi:hypothetical protein
MTAMRGSGVETAIDPIRQDAELPIPVERPRLPMRLGARDRVGTAAPPLVHVADQPAAGAPARSREGEHDRSRVRGAMASPQGWPWILERYVSAATAGER